MNLLADIALSKFSKLKIVLAWANRAVTPASEDVAPLLLWRVMSGLCLLWLILENQSLFSEWLSSGTAYLGGLAVVVAAILLMAPTRVRSAERWRQAVAYGSVSLILCAFAVTTVGVTPLLPLAREIWETRLLLALAVFALSFSLPSLLLQNQETIHAPASKTRLNFLITSPRLLRVLDMLAGTTGLLGLCCVPQQGSERLSSRILMAVGVATIAGFAAWTASYRGNLILEELERKIKFLIPEHLVRSVLACALFTCLGVQLVVAFRSAGPLTWIVLLFVLWVTARTVAPLLRAGAVGRDGRTHIDQASLCAGALAALSGLLWCHAAADPMVPDLFTLPCLLLVLALVGGAVLGGRDSEQGWKDATDTGSWMGATVRLGGNLNPLPVGAVLSLLNPRWAKFCIFVGRQAKSLQKAGNGLDHSLVQGVSAVHTVLRRTLTGHWPGILGRLALVLTVCWLALKDWLTSNAQAYPFAASFITTLAVGGGAIAACYVRRCGLWRDLLLAAASVFCLLMLVLPAGFPLIRTAMPSVGLLTFALALPRLLSFQAWRQKRTIQSLITDQAAEARLNFGESVERLSWRRVAARLPLSGRLASALYAAAALVGAAALLLAPSQTANPAMRWLPSLIAATCTAVFVVFCAHSPRPAARAVPIVGWGLCGVLYVCLAIPSSAFGMYPIDVWKVLMGMGISNDLSWSMPTFIADQGWITWALMGLVLLWALDMNAQHLAAQAGKGVDALSSGTERVALELSAGAMAALVALLFSGLICPTVLALCVASLMIAARSPRYDAINDWVKGFTRMAWGRALVRPRLALAGTTVVIGSGFLCAAAWSLSDGKGRTGARTLVPLASVPRAIRDMVPSDLPVAASWQDGYSLLRRGFGSRVAVPPSMSAAVAFHVTGADASASLPRMAAAALLAPLIGHWLPTARIQELYLNDRDYGLPASDQAQLGGTGFLAATGYYFHKSSKELSPEQAHFLVGEQPASGEPPFRFAQAGRVPVFAALEAPHFHLEVFAPLGPKFEYDQHDGSVNNRGMVASSVIIKGGVQAFVREQGQIRMLPGLGADRSSDFAVKVNERGQAVGWSTAPTGDDHAVLWETDGHVRDLGTLPGYANSRARSINSRGQVVGYAFSNDSGPMLEKASCAFLWKNGRMHNLEMPPGCTGSRAYAINDAGQVAGWAMTKGGETHAALWEGNRAQDLGAFPGGHVSVANAINNAGQIVGSAQHRDGHVTAFLWQNGILHDLGALPGDIYSSARDVNDLGQVVGVSRPDLHLNRPGGAAFVWDGNHGMRDLAALVDAAAPLRRSLSRNWQPLSINQTGQVLCVQFVGQIPGLIDTGTCFTILMTPARQDKRALVFHPASGGLYRFAPVNSGKVAGVAGASIVQGDPDGELDQEWVAKDLGNGYWQFANRSSGQCMAATGSSKSLGGALRQVSPHGDSFQQWELRPVVDGSFQFVNRGSSQLMGIQEDGVNLHQWKDVGGLDQHWMLQPVPRPASGGLYHLVCVYSKKVAGVAGASIVQGDPDGELDQEWVAKDLGNGYWQFANRSSGQCMAATGSSKSLGGALRQVSPHGDSFQQWELRPVVDGSFQFVNRGSGQLMGIQEDGVNLHQWKDVGGLDQHWMLQPVR